MKKAKRRTTDEQQLGLYFGNGGDDTPPLVLKLRGIYWSVTTLTRHRWTQLREVATAIIFCGLKSGCRASYHALLHNANQNRSDKIVGSERALKDVLREGADLGLLKSERETCARGHAPPLRWVDEATADALLQLTRETGQKTSANPEENEKSCPVSALSLPSLCPVPLYINNHLTSLTNQTKWSTVDGDDQKKAGWTDEEIALVRSHAREIGRKLGPPQCQADREVVYKAVYLVFVARTFPEAWVMNAVTAVAETEQRNRFAYFQKLLYVWRFECEADREAHTRKVQRALKRVTLPAELCQAPTEQAEPYQRMCAGGDA